MVGHGHAFRDELSAEELCEELVWRGGRREKIGGAPRRKETKGGASLL